MMVNYYRVTRDHRIAFGKGGWGIAFGGHLGADLDCNQMRARIVEEELRRTYPNLPDLKITYDGCGPMDRTPSSLPLLGSFQDHPQIIFSVGWSGNGVGPSGLGGKILASLALERKNHWGTYPLVEKSAGRFPPEPIRFVGAHLVRAAVAAKEKAEIQDEVPSWWAQKLSEFAPNGLEDFGLTPRPSRQLTWGALKNTRTISMI